MNPHILFVLSLVICLLTSPARAQVSLEPRPLFVEGYANQLSYVPGEEVVFHVNTSAAKYAMEIARLGKDRQIVFTKGDIAGGEQPIPENCSSHGCNWPESFKLKIPKEWRSGYYQVVLKAEDNGGQFIHRNRRTASGEAFFVVRAAEPGKTSKILLQLSTNTYNAYNNWGGHSLYAYHARGKHQGTRVSFNRPPSSQFGTWEMPFVAWAENNNIALEYAVNSDLEFHPEILKAYKLVLSVGHDEYWSSPMRDNLEAFIAAGGNVAFFSGNTCCWQVRSEEDGRALVSYKQAYQLDPLFPGGDHRLLATLWSHHLVSRPENLLTGVGFLFGGYHKSHGQFMDGSGAFTVHRPDHWIFAGTELKKGDVFGGKDTIVGYECDGCEIEMQDGLPAPTGRDGTPKDFLILGTCPARWHPDDSLWYEKFPKDRVGAAVMGLYTRGGTVFTCGSTDWAHGLRGNDPHVARITRNILERLSK
jgi:N,N-dimethylformamidase beta subunit-like protein